LEWVDYYDKVFDWSESTRVCRISDLTDIGSPDDIVDDAKLLMMIRMLLS